jgi:Tfp pilus assembly PilM family ATPase
MSWRRAKLLVALDAASVTGALVSWGAGGPSVEGLSRAALSPGALAPSPLDENVSRLDEVREALASVRHSLGTNGRRATLVLPDGVARTALIEASPGVPIGEYARFRLGQGLPYPVGEATVDALDVGGRRFLCGAVRKSVVEAYEGAVTIAGFSLDRVHLTPFAAVAGLQRAGALHEAAATDVVLAVILSDAAVSFAAFRRGTLVALRSRRREPGSHEADWLRQELARTFALAGGEGEPRIAVLGSGTPGVARELVDLGCRAEPAWHGTGRSRPVETAELAWLGAALS